MDIKALSEMEKKALAQISVAVYGEELARIMMPELNEYLRVSIPPLALSELPGEDFAKA